MLLEPFRLVAKNTGLGSLGPFSTERYMLMENGGVSGSRYVGSHWTEPELGNISEYVGVMAYVEQLSIVIGGVGLACTKVPYNAETSDTTSHFIFASIVHAGSAASGKAMNAEVACVMLVQANMTTKKCLR